MGYKPAKKLYALAFEDYPGLEVSTISCSIGQLMKISQMQPRIHSADETERMAIFEFFATRLVSWNIEHPAIEEGITCSRCGLAEGEPLMMDVNGLLCLDFDFVIALLMGWMTTVSRVTLPKGLNLNNGGVNTEDLMKQLGELQSPSKLPMPNLS